MRVKECTTSPAACCGIDETLSEAAHIMWDDDCGFVPVVDFKSGKLAGVVTDRDACMAAYTRGAPLNQIPVTSAMASNVVTVRPTDDVLRALERMAQHQVRRLPVVDDSGTLVGVISMNDVVNASHTAPGPDRTRLRQEVIEAMAAICRHRVHATA
jgi:CBS domain-containing protein